MKVFEEDDIDFELMENLPENSVDPLHLAAECLRDAFLEFSELGAERAEAARKIFICLK